MNNTIRPGKKPAPAPMESRHWRLALMSAVLLPIAMTGCGSDSDSDNDDSADNAGTGTFVDGPVSGLDYSGPQTPAGITTGEGEFRYQPGKPISFAIGDLELGSAEGAEILTPLSITDGASSVEDPGVA